MHSNPICDMADYSQSDICALKDTLCAQQQLLQKLYNELDAEREASATAASEALSVIIRLQAEKAAVKMEAEQYKRLSEERICHAEESLSIIKDIIYQKETHVAALECQVQAYRYKLLSMGYADPGFGEITFPEKLLQRNKSLKHNERENFSTTQEMDLHFKVVEDEIGREMYDKVSYSDKNCENSNSYWDQIIKLDSQVKEIAGGDSCDVSTSAVHDVFEVPQVDRNFNSCESSGKNEKKTAFDQDSWCVEKENFVLNRDDVKLYAKDESDYLKKKLDNDLSNRSSDIANIECRLAFVQPGTSSVSESRLGLDRLNRTSEIIEVERPAECYKREEKLKLLNEIKEKLNLLHDEIRSREVKKLPSKRHDEPSLCSLDEAMLYFWL